METQSERGSKPRCDVAVITDPGNRPTNQDRAIAVIDADDGAWVIAVADGIGGARRADETAEAALTDFPARIESVEHMSHAFYEASCRVADLCPPWMIGKFSIAHECPGSTICAGAWSPTGGMLVSWMGDTLPVLLSSRPSETRIESTSFGLAHRDRYGGIRQHLGAGRSMRESHFKDSFRVHKVPDERLEGSDAALIIMSDGVWEQYFRQNAPDPELFYPDVLADRIATTASGVGISTAADIASAVFEGADPRSMRDNASVATGILRISS